jgi:hypothetical protein
MLTELKMSYLKAKVLNFFLLCQDLSNMYKHPGRSHKKLNGGHPGFIGSSPGGSN